MKWLKHSYSSRSFGDEVDSALLPLMTCSLGIGVTCQLIMTCADVASWRYPFFSSCRVQLHNVRHRRWPACLTLQMCHVKELLDWPSVNMVPNLLRYFMLCILFCLHGSVTACLLGLWVHIPVGTCMSVVSVVCCQVEVCATGLSLVQSWPTECGVSEYDCEATIMRSPWPTGDSCAMWEGGVCVCVCVCVCVHARERARVCVCVCVCVCALLA